MKDYDVIIVGAGAAGLMCAIQAGQRGRSVLVLEKASKAGKKILISGGGRCNFTNLYTEPDAYLSHNTHFCKSALSRYTQWDFIALLEKHGLSWTEKTLGQLFCDQKAGAIVQLLLDECREANVKIQLNCDISSIEKTELFSVKSSLGDFSCESLVIATGGPSIPKMGATDFSQHVAEQFSLKTFPFIPGLVPFIFPEAELAKLFREISGTAVDVIVECNNVSFKEAILFTHRGLSGPAALQISSYWKLGDEISVNLLPDLDPEEWLKEQLAERPKAELKTLLSQALPKRLAVKLCELFFENKPVAQYNAKELSYIASTLSDWRLQPSGTEGMRTAEVALGGVNCDELSSKTLETKRVDGLYFIGESIDVTGHLGGYNFQWAWASGWCAGQYV